MPEILTAFLKWGDFSGCGNQTITMPSNTNFIIYFTFLKGLILVVTLLFVVSAILTIHRQAARHPFSYTQVLAMLYTALSAVFILMCVPVIANVACNVANILGTKILTYTNQNNNLIHPYDPNTTAFIIMVILVGISLPITAILAHAGKVLLKLNELEHGWNPDVYYTRGITNHNTTHSIHGSPELFHCVWHNVKDRFVPFSVYTTWKCPTCTAYLDICLEILPLARDANPWASILERYPKYKTQEAVRRFLIAVCFIVFEEQLLHLSEASSENLPNLALDILILGAAGFACYACIRLHWRLILKKIIMKEPHITADRKKANNLTITGLYMNATLMLAGVVILSKSTLISFIVLFSLSFSIIVSSALLVYVFFDLKAALRSWKQ